MGGATVMGVFSDDIYNGKSQSKMDDDWGYPHFKKPPALPNKLCAIRLTTQECTFSCLTPSSPPGENSTPSKFESDCDLFGRFWGWMVSRSCTISLKFLLGVPYGVVWVSVGFLLAFL